jgi:plasmid stabilization system protein ParE
VYSSPRLFKNPPPSSKIIWLEHAVRDLEVLEDRIDANEELEHCDFTRDVLAGANHAQRFPYAADPTKRSKTRNLRINNAFRLYYIVTQRRIQIVRVIHQRDLPEAGFYRWCKP